MSLVFAKGRNRFNLMQLQAGEESLGDERRNRPPSLAGVLLVSRDLQQALAGLLPRANSTSALIRDGLANMARTKPLSLGPKRWSGLEGELALAPSQGRYPLAYFRYVFFRWRDASGAHAFGLRAWEPFTESVRTLRALVTRLRPVAARRFSQRANDSARGDIPLARSPDWLLAACRALRTRPICPGRIPAARVSSLDLFFEPSIVGPGGRQAGPAREARVHAAVHGYWTAADSPWKSMDVSGRPLVSRLAGARVAHHHPPFRSR